MLLMLDRWVGSHRLAGEKVPVVWSPTTGRLSGRGARRLRAAVEGALRVGYAGGGLGHAEVAVHDPLRRADELAVVAYDWFGLPRALRRIEDR